MTLATARLLVGRAIVAVELRPFTDGRGGTAYDPVITLDNGARLTFSVAETAVGVYGVDPNYHAARRTPRRRYP